MTNANEIQHSRLKSEQNKRKKIILQINHMEHWHLERIKKNDRAKKKFVERRHLVKPADCFVILFCFSHFLRFGLSCQREKKSYLFLRKIYKIKLTANIVHFHCRILFFVSLWCIMSHSFLSEIIWIDVREWVILDLKYDIYDPVSWHWLDWIG